MRREISFARPPDMWSRRIRSFDEPGSMAYSAVTHPRPESLIHLGTSLSTEAVQRTRVSPMEINTEPGVDEVKPSSTLTGRSWSRGLLVIAGTLNEAHQTLKLVPGTARRTGRSNSFSASDTETDVSRYGGM